MYQEEETMVVYFSDQSVPQNFQITVIYGRYFEVWRLVTVFLNYHLHLGFAMISPFQGCIPMFPQIISISFIQIWMCWVPGWRVCVSHLGSGFLVGFSTFFYSRPALQTVHPFFQQPNTDINSSPFKLLSVLFYKRNTWKYFPFFFF